MSENERGIRNQLNNLNDKQNKTVWLIYASTYQDIAPQNLLEAAERCFNRASNRNCMQKWLEIILNDYWNIIQLILYHQRIGQEDV